MKSLLPRLTVIVVCLGPLLCATVFALGWLHFERKRSRVPVAFKLLRGPGETLAGRSQR